MSPAPYSLGLHGSLYDASFGTVSPVSSHPMSNSTFFRVLTASHRSSSVTSKMDPTSATNPLQGHECPGAPGSVVPGPSGALAQPIYRPSGTWAWIEGLSIRDCQDKIPLTSGHNFEINLRTGRAAGREIQYVSKSWPVDKKCDGFISELALYKKQLKPLQGIVVPNIIGVFTGTRRINVAMEVPHSSFWIESSSHMPDVLKKACIDALGKLHAQGVFHGNIGLSHFLIGGDARVTIVGFHAARALDPNLQVYLGSTTTADLRLELRKLKFKLDYQGAREREKDKFAEYVKRAQRNRKERLKATRDPCYSPTYEEDPESDRLDPPVDVRQPIGWLDALEEDPRRYIMPGQSTQDYQNALRNFLSILHQMETGHSRSNVVIIPSPSPPSSPAEASNTVVPISSVPRHVLSKRKRSGGPEVASQSSKRLRTSFDPQSIIDRPAGLLSVSCTDKPSTKLSPVTVLDCSVASNNASTDFPQIRVRDFAYEMFQPFKLVPGPQAFTSKDRGRHTSPPRRSSDRRKSYAGYPSQLQKIDHLMVPKAPSGVTEDDSITETHSQVLGGTEAVSSSRVTGKRRRDEDDHYVPEFSGHLKRMRLPAVESPVVNSPFISEIVAPPLIPLSIPHATVLPAGNLGWGPGSSAIFSETGHHSALLDVEEPSGLSETPLVLRLFTWWRNGLLRLIQ